LLDKVRRAQIHTLSKVAGDSEINNKIIIIIIIIIIIMARHSLVVKTLGYKPEGCRFETRCGKVLNLPNPSGSTNVSGE
jgi:hypothetical protein